MTFGNASEFILCFGEDLAYFEGVVLTGYSATKKADSWLLIIRVRARGGRGLCAFFEAETILECYRLLWFGIHTRTQIKWVADKFATQT